MKWQDAAHAVVAVVVIALACLAVACVAVGNRAVVRPSESLSSSPRPSEPLRDPAQECREQPSLPQCSPGDVPASDDPSGG